MTTWQAFLLFLQGSIHHPWVLALPVGMVVGTPLAAHYLSRYVFTEQWLQKNRTR